MDDEADSLASGKELENVCRGINTFSNLFSFVDLIQAHSSSSTSRAARYARRAFKSPPGDRQSAIHGARSRAN